MENFLFLCHLYFYCVQTGVHTFCACFFLGYDIRRHVTLTVCTCCVFGTECYMTVYVSEFNMCCVVYICTHACTCAHTCTFVSTQTICKSLAIALIDKYSGHSFRLHPEAVYAVVDDLKLPSNEGVAKVSNCYLLILKLYSDRVL